MSWHTHQPLHVGLLKAQCVCTVIHFPYCLQWSMYLCSTRVTCIIIIVYFAYSLQKTPQLPNMEFGRRLAQERELEKQPAFALTNARERTCWASRVLTVCFHCAQFLMIVVTSSCMPVWWVSKVSSLNQHTLCVQHSSHPHWLLCCCSVVNLVTNKCVRVIGKVSSHTTIITAAAVIVSLACFFLPCSFEAWERDSLRVH